MLLSEKNATINIVEEVDNDDNSQNPNNTNEVSNPKLVSNHSSNDSFRSMESCNLICGLKMISH